MNKAELVKAANKLKGGRTVQNNKAPNNQGRNNESITPIVLNNQNFSPPLREGRQYPIGYNMQEDIQSRLAALRRNNRN